MTSKHRILFVCDKKAAERRPIFPGMVKYIAYRIPVTETNPTH